MPSLTTNRQARHDYAILETFEAGLKLTGAEVKAAKLGQIKLQGAYVLVKGNEAWLVGARISPYHKASHDQAGYNPERDRKLLLHREQIARFIGQSHAQGLTIVPLSAYTVSGIIKLELGLARGKKKADKRATLKKREVERKIQRRLRQY